MTERILQLRTWQFNKQHHVFRKDDVITIDCYRDQSLPDHMRTALRLKASLDAETPVFAPDEIFACTRTIKELPMIYDDREWAEISSTHFIHERGTVTNLSPDYGKVIGCGLLKLREQLGDSSYHQAMRISIDAVLDFTERYQQAAKAMGDEELAQVLQRVPAYPAVSFREALQSLRILHYVMWCEGDYHNTLGRFDQYMMPYLQHDLDCGILNKESAMELLEAFFLSCNRDSDLYFGMQQGDNGQSIVLGGMTPDGKNGYNLLSEMCLKASAELRLIDPKINLRVGKDTPIEIFQLGTQLTKLGLGFPQYENDDVAIPALTALGYSEEDARNYAMAACWEFIIPGKGMEIPNIGALPIANVVNDVIREKLAEVPSMNELLEHVRIRMTEYVRQAAQTHRHLYTIPSPFMSLFFDGCLEQAQDISLGCRYNNFGLHGTGVATAADMLAAVEKTVVQGDVPVHTLLEALDHDFAGHEELQRRLQYQCPKMGNDDESADQYACLLLHMFAEAVKGLTNERGGIYRAGTGSAMYYIWHANELGATADGRKAGTPLPANYAPSLNVKLDGPVSLIKSFAKPDLREVINGGPLTIEFSDNVFRNDEAIAKVAALVKLFIDLGGHQLQLNTVNREQLLDAQKHPEAYRNLIVRVWGWSGYFVELDKCYQDHIISRAELSM